MNRTMDKVFKEIFNPIQFKTGTMTLRFSQKIEDDTVLTYSVFYNILDKKWTVITRRWTEKRPYVSGMKISKSQERRLIEKAKIVLEREWHKAKVV